ncbi:synaptonemal complex central element protein 2 isoform X1 [Hippocampus zosterae]|uniref:synaptonemal complex central element protein 2 isoform X1 n=1 Tax=Hippocampus zosterae TaxID=109293 RepID=UPI00223C8EF3|nr:synaptonemal complex central element protein 2 isoform X1 [Hippocampus zosterae]XP_051941051.1 synaptonemal complex central element protein 2 isoform X1 [Hippocampus zosterae]
MDFFFEETPISHSNQNKERDEDPGMVEDPQACLSRDDTDETSSCSPNDISRRVQELVEKIHDRRTSDQKEIESFQQSLVEKVTEVCQQMKQDLYTVYEENSSDMHVKLMELTNVLEMCTKLHRELLEASQVLASLQDGLAVSGTAEPVTG